MARDHGDPIDQAFLDFEVHAVPPKRPNGRGLQKD
jgi:hypothetical protein